MPFVSPAPVADFSEDTWWIWLIKAVFLLVFLILSVLMALWVERRGLGRIQTRPGPNVIGPWGLFQAIADALKLILKEDFWLKGADKILYLLAPIIAAFAAFMVYAVIPFGPNVNMFGINTPMQLADTPVSVLYILAVTGFGIYGMVIGGWSARSPYSLFGAVRSSAQLISYELSMGLALVTVFIVSGSMSTSSIVAAQASQWWVVALFPAFIIYYISIMGEVNRVPFDLPEAEGELVAGHVTEYSSMKFAWYYLAEYINMLNVSAVAVTLFLGGWLAPWPINQLFGGMFNTGWWPMLWFLIKVWFIMFTLVWIRGTLLRVRYDQLMKLGWKILIPAALVWLVAVAVVQGIMNFTTIQQSTLLIAIAVTFGVAILLLLLWPERKSAPEPEPAPFDAYEGGFPVPPMPGEALPVSPRRRRREAVLAMSAEEAPVE